LTLEIKKKWGCVFFGAKKTGGMGCFLWAIRGI
jgi:hypothetical protein